MGQIALNTHIKEMFVKVEIITGSIEMLKSELIVEKECDV
jgi:hypothetical protein